MALWKYAPSSDGPSFSMAPLKEKAQLDPGATAGSLPETDVDIDLREVYFLIMHFLSVGPCRRTFRQFSNELLEHQLLPRRYHAWYSRSGVHSEDENNSGLSFPLSYNQLVERYPHIENNHLLKLLKQLILSTASRSHDMVEGNIPNAADVPTLLGSGSYSLLESERKIEDKRLNLPPAYLRWPHMQADQVHGLGLREMGGGFAKHHRAPSIRAACYAVAKPSTMVQKMQNIKKLRGHRSAVYCAIFDRSGRYVITGSDDRLVKIWSKETAFCLASCRGHEGDITDLAVSSNNFLVASASNDFIIRVWRLPDGAPVSVLRGHTGSVTAIAFSPRPGCSHHLLSSSDDGTCRIWDARLSQASLRIYVPKLRDPAVGKSNGPSSSSASHDNQILCCAYNASGTVFVTGSSDTFARVWNACKSSTDDSQLLIHEMDVLSGHENDVNYVQFSGCAVASKSSTIDNVKEDSISKFKNSWSTHDNIVTCSRDGSAIIWIPRSRRSHGKIGRWTRAYHLKVPPPPMPPQSSRGGPRQRLLPTPRGVNMIVWSLDNRFVLAAIMDRRICVWNAVDGSLVHCLTGHSESTYVLDVHPFNPRIAMSAGYDGRTIIWDIWEGTPIRIYEIGRFKLVDGKFSPDGTSIVLSDDVGQLYTLSTGQGESQKDAKYDQFFLGDYRLLIQDTQGNVLDQETQLVPYRRNLQDLLCDSSMIPYPEPYQTMYQKRRLGALGIEYIPSSAKLSVGPADISGFQEYQIVPLMDLDRVVEPMPEFIDAMDWEPENEIQSDDNDSEYNVSDEVSSEGEQQFIKNGLFDDLECSAEETDMEDSQKDGFRRSKRKKHTADVVFMISSGRRIKKRHLDEHDGSRKSRKKKATVRSSSKSKLFRPQRAAVRNALKFSQFSEESTDDYEDVSESDSSENESAGPSLKIQMESNRSVQNVQQKNQRGKQTSLDECDNLPKPPELPESQLNTGSRRKLILKFPIRDTNKFVGKKGTEFDKQITVHGSLRTSPETSDINRKHLSVHDPGSSSGGMIVVPSQEFDGIKVSEGEQSENFEDDMSTEYKVNKIRWGEVKVRTSKGLRLGDSIAVDACPDSSTSLDDHTEIGYNVIGIVKSESGNGAEFILPQTIKHGDKMACRNDEQLRVGTSQDMDAARNEELGFECANKSIPSEDDHKQRRVASPVTFNGNPTKGHKEEPGPSGYIDHEQALEAVDAVTNGRIRSVCNHKNSTEEVKPTITKLRIKSNMVLKGAGCTSKLKANTAVENWKSLECNLMSQCLSEDHNLILETSDKHDNLSRNTADHGDWNGLKILEAKVNRCSRLSSFQDSNLSSDSNIKMYNVVYKRSKSYKAETDSEGDGSNHNSNPRRGFPEASVDGIRRTRSMGMKEDTREQTAGSKNFKVRDGHRSVETSEILETFSRNSPGQLLCEEWRSNAGPTVGLRSVRNQRVDYCDSDVTPLDKRKRHHIMRKLSWLMLSEHDESLRYIPQKGDNVVYLRQGHQQYIEYYRPSKVNNLWGTLKGKPRAVEFCKVITLAYSTFPGSGESCCKITLEFVDPYSSLFGQIFKLTLPELNDLPDFLVERTLYDASIKRNWSTRDKCRVWWKNQHGESGDWWDGRIVSVKPKSLEFPDSPWERYVIRYKNDSADEIDHSPWELHDPDTSLEHPCIGAQSRTNLLCFIAMLEESGNKSRDRYGIQQLKQISRKQDFLNRFPVPLSFDVIHSRLENNYYRNLESMEHDFMVLRSNAQLYLEDNTEFARKMNRLSQSLNETVSKLL